MPFDVNKFNNSPLEKRTDNLEVPELKEFFDDDENPVWIVRALSGSEIARAQESGDRSKMIGTIVDAMSAGTAKDKQEAVKKIFGVGDDVPDEIAKRIQHLMYGSVSPVIDRTASVRIFEFYPINGFQLTNRILELTGEGAELGKRGGSTVKKK